MNLKTIREKTEIIALFISFFITIVAIVGLVKNGSEVTEKMSLYLLLSWSSLVAFNYYFIKIIIKKNNKIKEYFRRSINDSLLQIKKIRKDKQIFSKTQFIKNPKNPPFFHAPSRQFIFPDKNHNKPINNNFIGISVVSMLPIIGLLGIINNEEFLFILLEIFFLFIYVSGLISIIYTNLTEVQNITENQIMVIEKELKKLRDEL
jgi:hypothetical protein